MTTWRRGLILFGALVALAICVGVILGGLFWIVAAWAQAAMEAH